MLKFRFALVLAVLCLSQAARAEAPAPTEFTASKATELAAMLSCITVMQDNASAGIITQAQADQATKRYLQEAALIAGRPITMDELIHVRPPAELGVVIRPQKLSAAQRFVGWWDFIKFLMVLGILAGTLCFSIVFVKIVVPLIVAIPASAYEQLFYLIAIGAQVWTHWLSPENATYVSFGGGLLLAGALSFSAYLKRAWAAKPGYYFSVLFVAFAVAAVVHHSSLIGFAAVMALLGALGFSVAAEGLCYAIGFKNEASVAQATFAAFAILTSFVCLKTFGKNVEVLRPFEFGALFMGSFVGYLGLLIVSSRWYHRRTHYALAQVITIVAGVGALLVGSVFGISELQKIGGTFFVLYIVEKIVEIPTREIAGKAAIGLVASICLILFAVIAKAHPATFEHFLLVNF